MGLKSILSLEIVFLLTIACSRVKERKSDVKKITSQQHANKNVPVKVDSLKNVSIYSIHTPAPFNIAFKKVAVFGNSKDTLFENIGHFAIDNTGNVYMVNSHKIEVFNPQGKHIKTLGGEGHGPGEFDGMQPLKPKVYGHKLYVYGHTLYRLNIYDTESLSFLQTININPENWEDKSELTNTFIRDFWPVDDSLFLFSFEDHPNENAEKKLYEKYYLVSRKGNIASKEVFKYRKNIDNTLAYAGKRFFMPFYNASGRYMCVSFGPDHAIYTSRTDHFIFKIYSPQGEYQRAIYYNYKNSPLDKEEIIDTFRFNKAALKDAKEHTYPATWPAIDRFFVDDDKRIWVAAITRDKKKYTWWVLNQSGKLIAKFKWKGKRLDRANRFRVRPQVKHGFWYIRQNNPDKKIKQIIKYKIQLKKKSE